MFSIAVTVIGLSCWNLHLTAASKNSAAVQAAVAAQNAANYGHHISVVNLTEFLNDLSRRLQFVMKAYQSNRINKSLIANLQQSSFIIAATKAPIRHDPDLQAQSDYQAVMYVIAVLMCYAAAICAMVVFNFKERRSQAKYEAYEDVVKRPRNYLYHYFREKYKDPSSVMVSPRKKSSNSASDPNNCGNNSTPLLAKQTHKASSSGHLLTPLTERPPPLPPLAYKISICSTDTTSYNASSPTSPISFSAETPALQYASTGIASAANSYRQSKKASNMTSLAAPSLQLPAQLSPTAEESCEGASEEESRGNILDASRRRSNFASRNNTEYSFGNDSGPLAGVYEIRRSPYLVVDHLEDSISSSMAGGVEQLDSSPRNHRQHIRLCPTSSDISSLGTGTPMRGSLHSFAGTSFADDDA